MVDKKDFLYLLKKDGPLPFRRVEEYFTLADDNFNSFYVESDNKEAMRFFYENNQQLVAISSAGMEYLQEHKQIDEENNLKLRQEKRDEANLKINKVALGLSIFAIIIASISLLVSIF